MLTLNIILLSALIIGLTMVGYQAYRNYQVRKINNLVYNQLNLLMGNVQNEVERNKILLEKTQEIFDGPKGNTFMSLMAAPGSKAQSISDVDAAPLLSSLITVLVSKKGTVRLSLADFESVEEEYVSIYVDPHSEELILSLNHDLASGDPLALAKFAAPDDNTFH